MKLTMSRNSGWSFCNNVSSIPKLDSALSHFTYVRRLRDPTQWDLVNETGYTDWTAVRNLRSAVIVDVEGCKFRMSNRGLQVARRPGGLQAGDVSQKIPSDHWAHLKARTQRLEKRNLVACHSQPNQLDSLHVCDCAISSSYRGTHILLASKSLCASSDTIRGWDQLLTKRGKLRSQTIASKNMSWRSGLCVRSNVIVSRKYELSWYWAKFDITDLPAFPRRFRPSVL
jgi:hypothetical protein